MGWLNRDAFAKGWKRLLIVPPLLIGAAAIFLAPQIKNKPQEVQAAERAVKVRAISVPKLAVVPRAVGYGTVEPARTWEAVAEVAGQVEWISDDLKNGRMIKAGSEVLRIEDVNYRLVLAQIEAQIEAAAVKDKTTRASLAIAEKDLKILEEDFSRKKGLAAKGAVATATVDAAQRQMLNGESQVQNLKNALELNAVERQVLIAQKASAELDLKRTHMIAPFDVRIIDTRIGEAQYANKGQLLFTADGLDVAEIEAQFPIGILRPLAAQLQDRARSLSAITAGVTAVVRLRTATHTVEWSARIDRVSGVIDPQTQSIGVVVAIDRPVELARPGERPPLYRNTFVEVELIAPPLEDSIVVPAAALHDGRIFVVDGEDRLDVRAVQMAFTQGGFAVLAKGVKPGERIVTSDLQSAIKGMLLDPQEDRKTKRNMVTEATGKEPQK